LLYLNQRGDKTHPADALGLALTRAEGVLAALVGCHDETRGGFVVADQFVLQSIAAVEGFIGEARSAYVDVCARCDLSLTGEDALAPMPGFAEEPHPPIQPLQDTDVLPQLSSVQTSELPSVAKSYDELLRKLTAAEIFAAERGVAPADQTSALLPLLKSLRQDLERLRAA
jgi:hypothetical protein